MRCGLFGELDLDAISNNADQLGVIVAQLADELKLGLRVAFALGQRDFRARDFHRKRHEVAVAGQAEIIEFAEIERSVSGSPSMSACSAGSLYRMR